MNNQQLRHYLDGLISEVRSQMATADRVLIDVAGAIDRYSSAHAEIQAIGAAIAQARQPLPQPMQQHGQPLPPLPAEDEVQAEWDRIRQQTPRVNGQHG